MVFAHWLLSEKHFHNSLWNSLYRLHHSNWCSLPFPRENNHVLIQQLFIKQLMPWITPKMEMQKLIKHVTFVLSLKKSSPARKRHTTKSNKLWLLQQTPELKISVTSQSLRKLNHRWKVDTCKISKIRESRQKYEWTQDCQTDWHCRMTRSYWVFQELASMQGQPMILDNKIKFS